jgi:hypothetical protein
MISLEEQLRLEVAAHGNNTSLAQMLRTQLTALKAVSLVEMGLTRTPAKNATGARRKPKGLGWQISIKEGVQPWAVFLGRCLRGGWQ